MDKMELSKEMIEIILTNDVIILGNLSLRVLRDEECDGLGGINKQRIIDINGEEWGLKYIETVSLTGEKIRRTTGDYLERCETYDR